MPVFFFDVLEIDGTLTEDAIGIELPSVDAAKRQAEQALAEITSEEIHRHESFKLRVRVRDEHGAEVNWRQSEITTRKADGA